MSRSIIMPIIMVGFFSFTIWYTAYRLHAHFKSIRFWKFQITTIAGVIGSLLVPAIALKFSNPFAGVLSILGGYIFLFFLYLVFPLAIVHILRLIWKPSLVWSGAAAIAIAFLAVFTGAIFASFYIVKETEIKIPRLEKELTVMQISDAHIGHHRKQKYLSKIVADTNKRNPDLILITGDLADAKSTLRMPGALKPLSDFKAPVYFVEGNHDMFLNEEHLSKLAAGHNIRIMRNEIIETHGIQLLGLKYINMHGRADYTGAVKSVLSSIALKNDVPSVLITHSPAGVKILDEAGIDLILAGHLHGGQFFPLFPLSQLSFPYSRGLYEQGNTKVFMSSGAGTSFLIRARLGSFNEINLIRLAPEKTGD